MNMNLITSMIEVFYMTQSFIHEHLINFTNYNHWDTSTCFLYCAIMITFNSRHD